ncbi:efflux RND transporter periplasmic adaptor subunit, partial [Draconibacterium sp.]|nr:efflux RND transporter periplasmic adaptor subunit [Draconibacterium sp.]
VAETSGRILEFPVNEGMYISRNVVIANIQNDMAAKDCELSKLKFEKAKRDFNRFRNLKTGEAVSENKMEEVELALKNAETTHTYAKERLDKTEILSPICGYITKVYAENGHFVSPGQPVLEITDIDKVKISVNLPSEQLKKLDKDTEISLTCASFPYITIHGSIFCIGRKANASGRFPVTLIMKNNQLNTLLPGMIGTVSFNMPPKATFVIPRSTLTGSVKTPEVFIVNQGYAIKKTISAIPLSSEYIQVLDGLKEDDSVVLSGQFNLSDSAKVRIVSNTKI